jgi:MinD-like ATPase involved in chromosome partitioning or flagellar assembly
MGQEAVPNMEWETFVNAAQTSDEVSFEGANGSFSSIVMALEDNNVIVLDADISGSKLNTHVVANSMTQPASQS